MNKIKQEFISQEEKIYKFKLGHMIASSLTGFIFGAIFASIIWFAAFKHLTDVLTIVP